MLCSGLTRGGVANLEAAFRLRKKNFVCVLRTAIQSQNVKLDFQNQPICHFSFLIKSVRNFQAGFTL